MASKNMAYKALVSQMNEVGLYVIIEPMEMLE